MSFSQEQQKQYVEKLMIDFSYDQWDITSTRHKQTEKDLIQAANDFVFSHEQSLRTRSDTEIATDGLLFRGLVWMSSFSDYAHTRLYAITECFPPFVKVSCTDEQEGWENYPVLYFTLKRDSLTSHMVQQIMRWLYDFAQGRRFIRCPIIYAQNGKHGQLRYEHDIRNCTGRVLTVEAGREKVLLANNLETCLRYVARAWWYFNENQAEVSG